VTHPPDRLRPTPERERLWSVPPLSTPYDEAVDAYRAGVGALVAGLPGAGRHLERVVDIDPNFLMGRAALAAAAAMSGSSGHVLGPSGGHVSRGERQHVEIVTAALAGDPRAVDLRREHLREYPGDLLIVWLPIAFTHLVQGDRIT
jgi:hypothetical protein